MVATLVAFLDAYNAGRVDAALALLTPDVVFSDCDYRAASSVTQNGLDGVRQWLTGRAVDHDQLLLESIANENPDSATGSHVVAVSYAKRTSDTLRSLGFPNGVKPETATKVVFTASDDRIRAFANGPPGGPSPFCRAIP
jgi:SnoaL-like protein